MAGETSEPNTADQTVILYDLPSRQGSAWSLNPWKTRLALNFKGVPYTTQWLEYPDIAPTLESFGIPPGGNGFSAYTIPSLRTASGRYIMDSRKIADVLEFEYPAPKYPSLHLDSLILSRVEELMTKIMGTLGQGVLLPCVPRNILNPVSAEYFERTRKERFGMPLAELERTKAGDAWEDVKVPLASLAALLKETSGPFFLGDTQSYSDFYYVTFMQFAQRCDQKVFERLISFDGALKDLYESYLPFLSKDD